MKKCVKIELVLWVWREYRPNRAKIKKKQAKIHSTT